VSHAAAAHEVASVAPVAADKPMHCVLLPHAVIAHCRPGLMPSTVRQPKSRVTRCLRHEWVSERNMA